MNTRKMNTRKMYPKKTPCIQYNGPQILYTRNKKKFCRNKTRFSKNFIKKSITSTVSQPSLSNDTEQNVSQPSLSNDDTEQSGILFCKKQNKETLIKWAEIFSISSKDSDRIPMKICMQLELWKRSPEPNMEMLRTVAKALKLRKNQYDNGIIKLKKSIHTKIYNHMTPTFKNIIGNDDVPINYVITLIYKILIPDRFSVHTKLDISEKMYKQLIEDKKNGTLDSDKEGLLNNSMKRKFEHCSDKLKFMNTFFTKISKDISKPYQNPKGLCYNSIYKNKL